MWRALTPAALLTAVACGTVTTAAPPASAPAATRPSPSPSPAPTPPPTPLPTAPAVASVPVHLVKEPDDHAHRNYCGAGATQVLVSAWTAVPDIELVARLAHLDPNRGQTGADTVTAVDTLLAPVTGATFLGPAPYSGRHVEALADVLAALRADLGDPRLVAAFGHGAPVMVQTMTSTLPGWHGWQATHMITIYAADLRTGDPARDTVTYAETPSLMAAYAGPPSQTITVAALWAAMVAHNRDATDDPVNLIALRQ